MVFEVSTSSTKYYIKPVPESFLLCQLRPHPNHGRPPPSRWASRLCEPSGVPSSGSERTDLQGWFAAWKAWKAFNAHHKRHQAACREARRNVLLQATEEAKTCAYKHDSRGVYQIIRRIAPKQSRQRLQLRAADGRMLTPTEEADALEEHFAGRFRETNLCLLRQAMGPWPAAEAPSLNPELLRDQLMQTPRRKAVPCNHPPSAVWRCCADIIAPWVCDMLRALWATDQVMVPSSWADVDLALVPKPAKAGRKPEDHRPIGLSCPLGKKVLSCLLSQWCPTFCATSGDIPSLHTNKGDLNMMLLGVPSNIAML